MRSLVGPCRAALPPATAPPPPLDRAPPSRMGTEDSTEAAARLEGSASPVTVVGDGNASGRNSNCLGGSCEIISSAGSGCDDGTVDSDRPTPEGMYDAMRANDGSFGDAMWRFFNSATEIPKSPVLLELNSATRGEGVFGFGLDNGVGARAGLEGGGRITGTLLGRVETGGRMRGSAPVCMAPFVAVVAVPCRPTPLVP